MNLPNSYITRIYPHKIARARVVYLTLMMTGSIVGPTLVTNVYEKTNGDITCWVLLGAMETLSAAFSVVAGLMVRSRLNPAEQAVVEKYYAELTPEQHELADRTGAVPVDEFFESIFVKIREKADFMCKKNKMTLLSGRMQRAIEKRLLRAIPNYPVFDASDPGLFLHAFAQDLADLDFDQDIVAMAQMWGMPELLKVRKAGTEHPVPVCDPHAVLFHSTGVRKRQLSAHSKHTG